MDKFAELPEATAAGAAAAVKAPGTPEELRLRGAVTGAWKGPVTGDTSRYNVEATIEQTAAGLVATVRYPELNCTSSWTEADINSQTIELIETLHSGHARCKDKSMISILSVGSASLIVNFGPSPKDPRALLKPQ